MKELEEMLEPLMTSPKYIEKDMALLAMKEAYNLALVKSAEKAWPTQIDKEGDIVDRKVILNLKLK